MIRHESEIIHATIIEASKLGRDDTLEIKKQFVVNEKNQKIAVQIDIDTFKKIEDLLENHILAQIMKESSDDKSYNVENARAYYQELLEKK